MRFSYIKQKKTMMITIFWNLTPCILKKEMKQQYYYWPFRDIRQQ